MSDERIISPHGSVKPDKNSTSPVDICGYPGEIIWQYYPAGVYEGDSFSSHWTCEWKVTVGDNQYGSWIYVRESNDEVSDKTREEAESVMTEHARESIKLVLKQNETRS